MNRNDTREYELVRTTPGPDVVNEWEECSCCGYPAPLHDFNADPCKIEGGPEWFCRLCANVVKSRSPEVARVQKTLLNIGNTILTALQEDALAHERRAYESREHWCIQAGQAMHAAEHLRRVAEERCPELTTLSDWTEIIAAHEFLRGEKKA